jgi:hypothetical protein
LQALIDSIVNTGEWHRTLDFREESCGVYGDWQALVTLQPFGLTVGARQTLARGIRGPTYSERHHPCIIASNCWAVRNSRYRWPGNSAKPNF